MDATQIAEPFIESGQSTSMGKLSMPTGINSPDGERQLLISVWRLQQRLEELSRHIEQIQAPMLSRR